LLKRRYFANQIHSLAFGQITSEHIVGWLYLYGFAKFWLQRYKINCKTKQYIAIICVYLCFFQRKDRFWQAKEVFLSYPFELGTTNYDSISHRKLTI